MRYAFKHKTNGEGIADGANENFSSTYGSPEGDTDDPEIKVIRDRQKRNIMATLRLSLGVLMILGGDKIGRSRKGNNNAHCQDNEMSWIDWSETDKNRAFLTFVTRLLRFRADHSAFRQSEFFHGDPIDGSNFKDIVWLSPDGREMTHADWIVPEKRSFGVRYAVPPGAPSDPGPAPLLLNAADTQVRFVLPAPSQISHGAA